MEPTLQQIKSAGLELSDDQIMAIFSYTQVGVKALESFRSKPQSAGPDRPVEREQLPAEQPVGSN